MLLLHTAAAYCCIDCPILGRLLRGSKVATGKRQSLPANQAEHAFGPDRERSSSNLGMELLGERILVSVVSVGSTR